MIRLGITGGIGSGKSVVARLLRVLGVPVYDCDAVARCLMTTDPVLRSELCALVGPEAYAGPELNKSLLAAYLFASPDHALRVNAIVHPRVKAHFLRWAAQRRHLPLVGIESAILVRAGFLDVADQLLLVTAPEATRIRRVTLRDHLSPEAVLRRIRLQGDEAENLRHARHLIVNDGLTPLVPQVLQVVRSLYS